MAASRPVAEEATAGDVVQGYAQVLQESLGRVNRNVFDLAGLKLLDDLQAIAASLARCLEQQEQATLRHWHQVLTGILPRYQLAFAEVTQAQAWLSAIRQVLAEAPLPTATVPGPGADAVARQLAHVLGPLADEPASSPWLVAFREQLWAISARYWSGLFTCYDCIGLPRTNNDLESLFGQMRRQVRRQTGFKQLRRPLLRQGAWLVYQPGETVADLQQRLARVPVQAYRAERRQFEQHQARLTIRYRWQRQRAVTLSRLEARWSACRAISTQ